MRKIGSIGVSVLVIFIAYSGFTHSVYASSHPTAPFLVDLRPGSTDPEVTVLQEYLNTNGFVVAPSGPGSLGSETDYFGVKTKRALIAFQDFYKQQILVPLRLSAGTGNFFGSTRNFINAGLATTTVSSSTSIVASPTAIQSLPHAPILTGEHYSSGGSFEVNSPQPYTIGGTVSGLTGTLVLQDNSTDNLSLTTNGSFTFATALQNAVAYLVSVFSQPASQTCTPTSASGSVNSANVTSVAVTCLTVPTITLGNMSTYFQIGSITLSATSNSSGSISYISSDPTVASISGTTATLYKAGTVTITATQVVAGIYEATSTTATLTVVNDSTGACDGTDSNNDSCNGNGECIGSDTGGSCECNSPFSGTYCTVIEGPGGGQG